MPDDLLVTVKKALAEHPERTNATCMEDVYRTWLRALLARCEAAEAEVERLNSPVLKSDWQQMVAERDAARAEAARLREARADDVALVARLSHQVVALRDAITRVLDGPHYIDRDYQDVLLAALDTPAREGGEGR